MTYHVGIYGFGSDADPHLSCDGCGLIEPAIGRGGVPKDWVQNRKAPRGWKMVWTEMPFGRRDYCPRCKVGKKDFW